MEQYISKSAVVAEIENIEADVICQYKSNKSRYAEGCLDVIHRIKHLLDTLEVKEYSEEYDRFLGKELKMVDNEIDRLEKLKVKEIDLEKEINKYICDNFFGSETIGFFADRTKEEPNDQDIALVAKYFFELGLKAQKGE